MRELEFLPAWYGQLQRRRRRVALQVWLTLVVVGGLGLWLFMADRNRRASEVSLKFISAQVQQTDAQSRQMDQLEAFRRQWRRKAQVLDKLGAYVDSGRMLGKLAEVMPPDVSLINLILEVEETPVQLSGAARAALKDAKDAPVDRKLRARLQGVAPTDVELATLLTELNKVPFLDNVSATFARDKREAGHILREFEVVFAINLNAGPRQSIATVSKTGGLP